MFDQAEVKWFNQVLFNYIDTSLNSNGTMKLILSVSSKEGLNFNSPCLLLSISNQLSKPLLLRIEHMYDIVENFDLIYKMYTQQDQNIFGVEFERKYAKNTTLILKTMKKVDSGELIFRLILQSGLNDLTFIDFRFRIFQAIYKLFTNFTDSYTNICFGLLNKQIDTFNLEAIKDIPLTLKAILSNLNSIKVPENPSNGSAQLKIPEESEQLNINKITTDKTIAELDEFLGRDMKNIKVPGIEEIGTKEYKPEITSKFVLNVLDKNLYNLQKFLTSIKDKSNALEAIINFIKSGYQENFNPLPEIKENEYNSTTYLSEVIWKTIILLYQKNQTPIPYGAHVIYYKNEQNQPDNVSLAFDLLLLMSYIKVLRTRLEDKTPDYIENCSMFYMQFRYLMGVLCFSFIRKNQDATQVSNIIKNRFTDYNKIGFFDYYNNKLENFNCKPITEIDILKDHNDFFEKLSTIKKDVIELHEELYRNGNLTIPPNSEFNREQIINEIIPLQILRHTGEDLELYKSKYSENLISMFAIKKEAPIKEEKPKEEKSNIVRYIEANKDKIPEKDLKFLLKVLKKLKNKNFKFEEREFSYIEFEDEIIKALHVWKPEDDTKLINNYSHFLKCCEECLLTKQQILSLSAKVESSSWSNIDMFLEK